MSGAAGQGPDGIWQPEGGRCSGYNRTGAAILQGEPVMADNFRGEAETIADTSEGAGRRHLITMETQGIQASEIMIASQDLDDDAFGVFLTRGDLAVYVGRTTGTTTVVEGSPVYAVNNKPFLELLAPATPGQDARVVGYLLEDADNLTADTGRLTRIRFDGTGFASFRV